MMASPLKAQLCCADSMPRSGSAGKIWCYININAGSLQLVSTKSWTKDRQSTSRDITSCHHCKPKIQASRQRGDIMRHRLKRESEQLQSKIIQVAGLGFTIAYAAFIVWIYATEPRTFKEVTTSAEV